ncbi:MAG: hypothetical protein ABIH23_05610 [bacterium]
MNRNQDPFDYGRHGIFVCIGVRLNALSVDPEAQSQYPAHHRAVGDFHRVPPVIGQVVE